MHVQRPDQPGPAVGRQVILMIDGPQVRCVSRRKAPAASTESTIVQAIMTAQPRPSQPRPPSNLARLHEPVGGEDLQT